VKHLLTFIFMLLTFFGCAKSTAKLKPVKNFELNKYLGTWHEIARLNHSFERDMIAVTANYSLNNDGTVKVLNKGYNTRKKEFKEAVGKARFKGEKDIGLLEVSFFGPFYGEYKIIALAKDYSWSMVTSSRFNYFWILSRTPELNNLDELLVVAKTMGFDTQKLIFPKTSLDETK
jgi:apolipoprotein D and lipocalin family protein